MPAFRKTHLTRRSTSFPRVGSFRQFLALVDSGKWRSMVVNETGVKGDAKRPATRNKPLRRM
jgi:hypothetical protein